MQEAFDAISQKDAEKQQRNLDEYLNNLNDSDELEAERTMLQGDAALIGGKKKDADVDTANFGSLISQIEREQKFGQIHDDEELQSQDTDFTYPEPDQKKEKHRKIIPQKLKPKQFGIPKPAAPIHHARELSEPKPRPGGGTRYRDQRASFASKPAMKAVYAD